MVKRDSHYAILKKIAVFDRTPPSRVPSVIGKRRVINLCSKHKDVPIDSLLVFERDNDSVRKGIPPRSDVSWFTDEKEKQIYNSNLELTFDRNFVYFRKWTDR